MLPDPIFLNPHGGGDYDPVVVDHSPFSIGRRPENDLEISQTDVSGRHAVLRYQTGKWNLIHQKSRNGTFLNGQRISRPEALTEGDVIHIATRGYQVALALPEDESASSTVLADVDSDVQGMVDLMNIIKDQRTYPYFQPIFDLTTNDTLGYEALGRAATTDGAMSLGKLFALAGQTNVETALSTAFRKSARACAECRHCWTCDEGSLLFLNVHPKEILNPDFQKALEDFEHADLKKWYRVVIEVPETWISNTEQVRSLAEKVRALGIKVAYDDFGAGQSRLAELIAVPPDFLKLDRELVTGLGDNQVKQRLVKAIVNACQDLNVTTLAEGIETPEELQACLDLRIDLGQGFLLGSPQPAYEIFDTDVTTLVDTCPFVQLNIINR